MTFFDVDKSMGKLISLWASQLTIRKTFNNNNKIFVVDVNI